MDTLRPTHTSTVVRQNPTKNVKSRYLVVKDEITIPNPKPKKAITKINKGKQRNMGWSTRYYKHFQYKKQNKI
jgi:hypothetical protein